MKKFKKLLASLIVFLLSFGPILGPLSVFAEDASPSPTPEPIPEPQIQVNNTETTVTTQAESTANTGPTASLLPSTEPLPTVEPNPSPEPSPSASPELSPPADSPPPTATASGDAISVVEVANDVNSTSVNSQIIYKTLNIFVDGDINLADSGGLQAIIDQALTGSPADEANVSVSFDGINVARVSNDLVSVAATGGAANTGDAYSVVSLFNQVNTTIIDSQIYLVTVNIFGDVAANIILPELNSPAAPAESTCCDGQQISVNNQATVSNQINSQAITSPETVTAATDTVVENGDAISSINVVNVVNTTLINTSIRNLVINVLGNWIGSWLGAQEWQERENSANTRAECDGCRVDDIDLTNQAEVDNQILSRADTSGGANTGDAYSNVSLFNFINTTIINSTGFWGFVNIFGSLTGDVGTAEALYPSPTPEPSPSPAVLASTGPEVRETGGQLTISQSNNVGEYILPGDTVTFDVLVKNPGAGKVYDAKLWIGLVKDGQNAGGSYLNIGNMDPKKGVKISTGLVLSENAPWGEYQGIAQVVGYVGPYSHEIQAEAWSDFLIAAFTPFIQEVSTPVQAEEETNPQVLGETIAAGVTPFDKILKLFWILLALYALMLAIEKRKQLAYTAIALRSLLFALIALIETP